MSTSILRNKLLLPIYRSTTNQPVHRLFLSSQRSLSNTAKARLRRSVHFVPGDNLKFLSKSISLGAGTAAVYLIVLVNMVRTTA